MQQPPLQDPTNPTDQPWQPSPYSQSEQPSVPPSEPLSSPQAAMQPPPDYHPVMPDNPWQQQQTYPPQPMYQQPIQPPPNYNPVMPASPWQQQQAYPPQPMYQQPMQPPPNYNPVMPANSWQQQQTYPPQPMYQQPMQPPVQVTAVNINMNAQQQNNGCVRALYFVFIGWWLSFWCLQVGFFLCALIVTLPLGLMILNRIPQIMTLKPSRQTVQTNVNVTSVGGAGGAVNVVNVNVNVTGVQQHPMLVRALYYIFVGCWAGYLWASLAYFLCLTILGLPLGIVMFNYLPAVLTLRKS